MQKRVFSSIIVRHNSDWAKVANRLVDEMAFLDFINLSTLIKER